MFIRRTKRNAIVYLIASVLAFISLVSALVGGGIYLASVVSPMGAAFIIAALTLALSLVLFATIMIINRRERRRNNAKRMLATSAAFAVLRQAPSAKTLLMLAAAGGVGYLALRAFDDGEDDA